MTKALCEANRRWVNDLDSSSERPVPYGEELHPVSGQNNEGSPFETAAH